jgi:single-stranded DNA-binding protein
MGINTFQSMSGFIAEAPHLSHTHADEARLELLVGQHHYIRHLDGTFTQEAPTFHDLVITGRTAEMAAARFAIGDEFVAEGYIHTYTMTYEDGQMVEHEAFVARKIGHRII